MEKRFTIAVVSHSGVKPRTVACLVNAMKELTKRGWDVDYMPVRGCAIIENARAEVAHEFLKRPSSLGGDRLVMIDDDVTFHWSNIEALALSGEALIGATYAAKNLRWEHAAKAMSEGRHPMFETSKLHLRTLETEGGVPVEIKYSADGDALIEVEALPTGLLSMTREALLQMCDAYPDLAYTLDNGEVVFDIFDCERARGRKFGEDYSFCRRWRAIGGRVMLLLGARRVGHIGQYEFYGRIEEFFPDVMKVFEPTTTHGETLPVSGAV